MKKPLTLLAIAVIMAITLTACGVQITQITLPADATIAVGETTDLVATFSADNPEISEEKIAEAVAKLEVKWTSSDEAIASVDANGVVTGVAGGIADITVTTGDGSMSATASVTVTVPLESIEVEAITINTIDKTATAKYTLVPANATVGDIVVSLSDESIATVAGDEMTILAAGTCDITVTSGDISSTATLTVQQAPSELVLEDAGLYTGYSGQMVPSTIPANVEVGKQYTYKSADPSIVTVTNDGTIKGVKPGATTVIVTNEIGQTVEAKITVTNAPPPPKPVTTTPKTNGKTSGTTKPSTGGSSGGGAVAPPASGGSGGGGGGSAPAPAPAPAPDPAPAPPAPPVHTSPDVGTGTGNAAGSDF